MAKKSTVKSVKKSESKSIRQIAASVGKIRKPVLKKQAKKQDTSKNKK